MALPITQEEIMTNLEIKAAEVIVIDGVPYVEQDGSLFSPDGVEYQLVKTQHFIELAEFIEEMMVV